MNTNTQASTPTSARPRPIIALAMMMAAGLSGCTYAAVISRPGENQARIVYHRLYQEKVMHCTAQDPKNPTCKVMDERP